jgi:MoaA/NifB/PqqE/SkfB family radical SAM enzyme
VQISLTDECPYSCFYCSNDVKNKINYSCKKDVGVLTTEEVKSLIFDLQNMGVSIIGLTGGEPLLRDDLSEIVNAIDVRSKSFLYTSGYELDEKKIRNLKNAGLFSLGISLDCYGRGNDEKFNLEKGFSLIEKQVVGSKRAGIYTIVQVPLTKIMTNENVLFDILCHAKKLGAHEVRFMELTPSGKLLSMDNLGAVVPSADDIERVFEFQKKLNLMHGFPAVNSISFSESCDKLGCGAGINNIYIDAYGDVFPCDFIPVGLGNVRDKSISEIFDLVSTQMWPPGKVCFLKSNLSFVKSLINEDDKKSFKDKFLNYCKRNKKSKRDMPNFYRVFGNY